MPKRQFARKQREAAQPNLRLVSPPKPKRRTRRWKLPPNLRKTRKAKWPPELLRFEEDTVLRAVEDLGGRATVERLTQEWPGRFREKQLWWALIRLADAERLKTAPGLGLLFRGRGTWSMWTGKTRAWFERHKLQKHREFWT